MDHNETIQRNIDNVFCHIIFESETQRKVAWFLLEIYAQMVFWVQIPISYPAQVVYEVCMLDQVITYDEFDKLIMSLNLLKCSLEEGNERLFKLALIDKWRQDIDFRPNEKIIDYIRRHNPNKE